MRICLLLVAGAAALPRAQGGDLIRSGWEAEEAWARGGETPRRQVTRRQGRRGSIVRGEASLSDESQQQVVTH